MIGTYPPHYHSKCNPDYRNKSAIELNTVSERMAHLKARLEETMKSLLTKSKSIQHPDDHSVIRISEHVNMSESSRIVEYTMSLDHSINKYGDKLRWLKIKITTITPSKKRSERISTFAVKYVLPENEDTLVVYDGQFQYTYSHRNFTHDNHWARKVTKQLFDESNIGNTIEQVERVFNGPGILIESEFHRLHKNRSSISIAAGPFDHILF